MRLASQCAAGVVIDTNVLAHSENPGNASHPSAFAVVEWIRDHATMTLVLDDQGKAKPNLVTSLLFAEYRNTLQPLGFALTVVGALLSSGRVDFADRPDQSTRRTIRELVPQNSKDQAVLGAACGCVDRTLVSNDYTDFPDDVRDACRSRLNVEVFDSDEAAA